LRNTRRRSGESSRGSVLFVVMGHRATAAFIVTIYDALHQRAARKRGGRAESLLHKEH
jgi:hypothetical protein